MLLFTMTAKEFNDSINWRTSLIKPRSLAEQYFVYPIRLTIAGTIEIDQSRVSKNWIFRSMTCVFETKLASRLSYNGSDRIVLFYDEPLRRDTGVIGFLCHSNALLHQ